MEVPAGSTIDDLLRDLGISMDPNEILLVVNGKMAEGSHTLTEGDEVHFIPAISGGKQRSANKHAGGLHDPLP
jgi:sulfur carrier protein ThiS